MTYDRTMRKFRTDLGLPVIALPGQRRIMGGKDLNGAVWIQIEGRERITMPPRAAVEFAVGILKACGIELQEVNVDELIDG